MTTTDPTPNPTEATPNQPPLKTPVTPTPEPDAFTDEQQKKINALMGNTRKEASAASLTALAKELGYDSVDDMKAAAKEAKAKKDSEASELEKATKRAEQAEKKAADAESKAEIAEAKRIATFVDSRLLSVVKDAKAVDPNEVVQWLRDHQTADVDALYLEGDKFNDKGAEKIVADFKKVKEHWFQRAGGVGSPSVNGGRPLQPDADMNKVALAQTRMKVRQG